MYEAPEVLAIGNAHEIILGEKPFLKDYVDEALEVNRDEPVGDIDETD